uniref:BTB domain-containing protein n=1 Tax=Parastrongyloides trichosuri TaxID=131310 RepID=A0A0N5A6K0_PARTI
MPAILPLKNNNNNDYKSYFYEHPPRFQSIAQKGWHSKMENVEQSNRNVITSNNHRIKSYNWNSVMNNFRKNDVFTDVTLCENIKAHKCFLASKSKYFEKLFINPVNKNKDRFEFPNINEEAMNVVIDFLYTDEINVDKNNADEVLTAAGELEIDEIIMYCEDICKKQVDKNRRLRSEKIISKNKKELYLFGGLSWSRTEGYIIAPTEVYNLNENSRNTKEQYLPNIDNKKLLERFGNTLTLIGNTVYAIGGQNHDEILNTIESIEMNSLTPTWKKVSANFCFNSKHLESVTIGDKVYMFGVDSNNYRDKNCYKGFHILDLESMKMVPSTQLPINLYTPAPVAVDKTIYVVGDDIDNRKEYSWIRKKSILEDGSPLYRIDTRMKEWSTLAPTKQRKFESSIVSFNNMLYSVGGGYPHACEIYDIRGNSWREMASPTTASYYSRLTLLDGKIHKFGHSCFNEVYEPKIDEWIKSERLRHPRYGFNLIVI